MSAKEFLKEYCKDKLNAGCVILEFLLTVTAAVLGDYRGVVFYATLTAMLIIFRLHDMQYECLRHYTDKLEKRHFELLSGLIAFCEQKEKGQGE